MQQPRRTEMSYTYALLEVSRLAYDEIAGKLRAAGYDHAFGRDEEIDMHGIAIIPEASISQERK